MEGLEGLDPVEKHKRLLASRGITVADSDSQTDIELMILKMAEVFMAELVPVIRSLGLNMRAQNEMLEKMRFIINRIMNRAQRGLIAMGMAGVTIHESPKKKGEEQFTDMHGYSSGQKEPMKKSWHFSLNETGGAESNKEVLPASDRINEGS